MNFNFVRLNKVVPIYISLSVEKLKIPTEKVEKNGLVIGSSLCHLCLGEWREPCMNTPRYILYICCYQVALRGIFCLKSAQICRRRNTGNILNVAVKQRSVSVIDRRTVTNLRPVIISRLFLFTVTVYFVEPNEMKGTLLTEWNSARVSLLRFMWTLHGAMVMIKVPMIPMALLM